MFGAIQTIFCFKCSGREYRKESHTWCPCIQFTTSIILNIQTLQGYRFQGFQGLLGFFFFHNLHRKLTGIYKSQIQTFLKFYRSVISGLQTDSLESLHHWRVWYNSLLSALHSGPDALSSVAMMQARVTLSECISSLSSFYSSSIFMWTWGLRPSEACLYFKLWQSGVILSRWVSRDFHYLPQYMTFCWMKAENCKLLRILKVPGNPSWESKKQPRNSHGGVSR